MLYVIQLAELLRKAAEYSPASNDEEFLDEVDNLSKTLEKPHQQRPTHSRRRRSSKGNLDKTGLHYVAISGNLDAVRLLLSCGADPNERNSDGMTPLVATLLSCREKQVSKMVSVLIDNGADVNVPEQRTGHTRTPLHIAAQNGMAHIVGVLLEAGADPNRKESKAQETPLQMVLRCLKGTNPEKAIKYTETALVLLRYSQVDVLNTDNNGETPLALSVMSAQPSVINTLISRGNAQFDKRDLQQAIFLMEHYDTSHDREEILSSLKSLIQHRCPSLQSLAREAVRSAMPRRLSLVKSLDVPSNVKDFLLHQH